MGTKKKKEVEEIITETVMKMAKNNDQEPKQEQGKKVEQEKRKEIETKHKEKYDIPLEIVKLGVVETPSSSEEILMIDFIAQLVKENQEDQARAKAKVGLEIEPNNQKDNETRKNLDKGKAIEVESI